MAVNIENKMENLSIPPLQQPEHLLEAWEQHMASFCPGRNSAFELSAALIFACASPSVSNTLAVADIACGYGGWSHFMQATAATRGKNIYVTAFDDSIDRLTVCQSILGECDDIVPGQLQNTLLLMEQSTNNVSFDAAFFGWAAHEMPWEHLEQIYQALRRLLKPGGILLIADFVSGTSPAIDQLSQKLTQFHRDFLMTDPRFKQQEQMRQGQRHHHSSHAHHTGHRQRQKHYAVTEHIQALHKVGFTFNEEVWRYMNNAMIMSINPG